MKFKNIAKTLICSVICVVTISCLIGIVRNRSHYSSCADVVFNMLFLFEDQTEYAPKYSEIEFKKITKGITQKEVIDKLGEPLSKETYTNKVYVEIWRYTKGPPNASYWFRVITFDLDKKVQDVEREYFVD